LLKQGGSKSGQTLRENIHGIVDLDIHVVTDCRQLFLLGRNDSSVKTLDFPGARSVLGKTAGNKDGLAILFRLVSLVALILQLDCHFGDALGRSGVVIISVLETLTLALRG
jgi:hypothetical protein